MWHTPSSISRIRKQMCAIMASRLRNATVSVLSWKLDLSTHFVSSKKAGAITLGGAQWLAFGPEILAGASIISLSPLGFDRVSNGALFGAMCSDRIIAQWALSSSDRTATPSILLRRPSLPARRKTGARHSQGRVEDCGDGVAIQNFHSPLLL